MSLLVGGRTRRALALIAAILLLLSFTAGTALAHERREVGPYTLVVGWTVEPALVEQPNGLDLRVTTTADEQPVTGLENTLRAEVIYGDKTMPLELRPRFGQPGAYIADIIPTLEGSYIFRISGQIGDLQIDEQFNSADGEFSDVLGRAQIQFPEQVTSVGELQGQLAAAQQAAGNARLMGLGGLVAGLLGLALGGVALLRQTR